MSRLWSTERAPKSQTNSARPFSIRPLSRGAWIFGLLLGLLFSAVAQAQIVVIHPPILPPRPPFPTPIPRPRPAPPPAVYKVRAVDVTASVQDQGAKVQLTQTFENTGSVQVEAQIFFPMPDNAAVSGLTLLVDGKEFAGKLLKKEEARKIYEDIVRTNRDPALLEYVGQGVFQTSVFPVPAGATRKVEIRYTQLLKKDNGLVDLILPVGASKHGNHPIESLSIDVRVATQTPLKTIYSPTHSIELQRSDSHHAVCKLKLSNVTSPDDVRIFFGTEGGLVGAYVVSYRPSDSEDGYFVLLANPDVKATTEAKVDRTLLFVFDKSGSMTGKKFEQAKQALKFLVQRIQPGDVFNIIAYDSNVESFRPELQRGDETSQKAALAYVDGLFAGGSTNIDGALTRALGMVTDTQRPTYVLFMTDGLPTVGELSELKIAANAKANNKMNGRLFNFGVGHDVNSRLLDRLSDGNRGLSIYVRPNEDIEAHVSNLYNKIGSPLLVDMSIAVDFDRATPAGSAGPISRTYPKQLTDLYQGEQLVWVGRYKHGGPAKITINGSVAGEKKSFSFPVNFAEKSNDDSQGFVEKLWATRRVGEIINELDLRGQNKELIDELVGLSIKHGIITPYTSFLADDTVRLGDRVANSARATSEVTRQLSEVGGAAGFEQRSFKGDLSKATNSSSAAPAATAPIAKPGQIGGFPIGGGGLAGRGSAPPSAAPGTGTPGETGKYTLKSGAASSSSGSNLPTQPGTLPKTSTGQTSKLFSPSRNRTPGKNAVSLDADGYYREKENVRQLGQKTFFLKNNVWQDSVVTEPQLKNVIRVKQFSPEYFDLAVKHGPHLSKYLVFTEPVVLNLGDKTYQIDPDAEPAPEPATESKP